MKKFKLFQNKKDDTKEKISEDKWPDHVINLDEKNFEDFIKRYPLSVVDFWAPWCAPCKAMAPRLRRLSNIYKGNVAFGKINTQQNQDLSKKYKITGIPHLELFKFGEKISSITGLKSVGDIKKVIDKYL